MENKVHYLRDRIVVSRDTKPLYAFKIKGGIYGDLHEAVAQDRNRFECVQRFGFSWTQYEYNGSYE